MSQVSKLIPNGAKVLDLGAGNGLLAGVLLHSHTGLVIDGIEPNKFATDLAKKNYRNFYSGYAEEYFSIIRQENYDFIVLADVIEHMADPLIFLQTLNAHVSPSTKIVISTPNVAFGAVRVALMNGEFRYVNSGLLERTHLRFFTRETLLELGERSGFTSLKLRYLLRDMQGSEIPVSPSLKNLLYLLSIAPDELAHTYQFLAVLSKGDQEPSAMSVTRAGRRSSVVMGYIRTLLRKVRNTVRNHIESGR